jgi:thymidylate synthase
MSRQAVIQIYDGMRDTQPDLKDRPCNTQLQFLSRLGELHVTVTVRSNDLMWGWSGINAFEWSTLQEIVARMLGVNVGTLTFNIGSFHLYGQHWEKARRISRDGTPPLNAATSVHQPYDPHRNIGTVGALDTLLDQWFDWEQQCRVGRFTGPLHITEPLFRSWAQAIAYYWTGEQRWLDDIGQTRLALAIAESPFTGSRKPLTASQDTVALPTPTGPSPDAVRAFLHYVTNLHAIKDASYGDSWMKRGEQLSILANIARKVDRMGQGDEFESSADTALDLWVYLNKYICWLRDVPADPEHVNVLLEQQLNTDPLPTSRDTREVLIRAHFEEYLDNVEHTAPKGKVSRVRNLAGIVAPLARDLWIDELGGDAGTPCED